MFSTIWRKYKGFRTVFQPAKGSQRRGLKTKITSRIKLGKCGLKAKMKLRCNSNIFTISERFEVVLMDSFRHTKSPPSKYL